MPRRSKRVRQIAEEAGVLQEEEATKAAFEHLEDRSLFFVDTGDEPSGKRRRTKDPANVKLFKRERNTNIPRSKAEEVHLKRAQKRKQPRPSPHGPVTHTGTAFGSYATEPEFDVWAEDGLEKAEKKAEYFPGVHLGRKNRPGLSNKGTKHRAKPHTPRTVPRGRHVPAVTVAAPGLSYNPSVEDHQDALGEAVAAELERQAQIERNARARRRDPEYELKLDGGIYDLLQGKSADDVLNEDQAQRSSAADDSFAMWRGEDSDDDDAAGANVALSGIRPAPQAKTSAQRKREEKTRREKAEAEERRRERQHLHHMETAPGLAKRVEAQNLAREKKRQATKEERARRDAEAKPKRLRGGKEDTFDRAVEVPLTEELSGSLRKVRTVRSIHPVEDRFDALLRQDKVEIGQPKGRTTRKRVRVLRNK